MSIEIILMLFVAGLIAGGVNAIAGGATLLTFPVLMAAGLPPTVANATNFLAVLPGNAAAIPAYATKLRSNRQEALRLVLVSLAGGAIGAILLVVSTDNFFLELVPWLILMATLVYAFGKQINIGISRIANRSSSSTGLFGYFLMFVFSIYGGYFGAGLGIITLAVLKIMGYMDFHKANALKNLTNTTLSLLGVAVFVYADLIAWPQAFVMMAGAGLGGYASAYYAHRVSQIWLHYAIVVLGFCLSIYYFLK